MFKCYNLNKNTLCDIRVVNNIKDIDSEDITIKINTIEQLHAFKLSKFYNKILRIIIPLDLLDNKEVHTLYFLGRELIVDYNDKDNVLLNPMISSIYNVDNHFMMSDLDRRVFTHKSIPNAICHIDVTTIMNEDISVEETIIQCLNKVWTYFIAFDISNLPDYLSNEDIINIYKNVAQTFGDITKCFPVNKKDATKVFSRDIKYTPNIKHFYASNIRQPFHNDYAHYPIDMAPDWLMLYSLEQSKYGGITSLLSIDKLKEILQEFNTELLESIDELDVNYLYYSHDGNIIHTKKLITDNTSNWNYFQIKEEYNNENVIKIRNKLFEFLEKTIVDGHIYDLSKNWKRGDCVLFNDHRMMHCRSAFLGSRWLKDYAFKDKTLI